MPVLRPTRNPFHAPKRIWRTLPTRLRPPPTGPPDFRGGVPADCLRSYPIATKCAVIDRHRRHVTWAAWLPLSMHQPAVAQRIDDTAGGPPAMVGGLPLLPDSRTPWPLVPTCHFLLQKVARDNCTLWRSFQSQSRTLIPTLPLFHWVPGAPARRPLSAKSPRTISPRGKATWQQVLLYGVPRKSLIPGSPKAPFGDGAWSPWRPCCPAGRLQLSFHTNASNERLKCSFDAFV
jgi:hypothetical protein